MPATIRIATRGSALALWQANEVKSRLEQRGYTCEIVTVQSSGDVNLTQPIYALGIAGVFTKELDAALLNNDADIAVHSLKDVPTQLAQGLALAAVLERGAHQDVAIIKRKEILNYPQSIATIATSSLRRRAQWLAKFPKHVTVPIRGNVQTRMRKFNEEEKTDAVIFAKAGLERMNMLPDDAVALDWMLPAPAQGIVGIVCRENASAMQQVCEAINHQPSFIAGSIERDFMKTLMGGCSVPVSALALVNENGIEFRGAIHAFDGSRFFEVKETIGTTDWKNAGRDAALKLLKQPGAAELMEEIRNKKWSDADTEH
ncbi:MAG: hydroxymethylbilane synthase [Chitinophagales bacterium]|nr:hydroxymethylbilane synthase [Chitinophagales bacterium]